MEDLACAVVSKGIVVMREWKIKDAQWKVYDWTISMCLAQRDKALQTISHEALITHYSRKYDLRVPLQIFVVRVAWNIENSREKTTSSCFAGAFPFKTCQCHVKPRFSITDSSISP